MSDTHREDDLLARADAASSDTATLSWGMWDAKHRVPGLVRELADTIRTLQGDLVRSRNATLTANAHADRYEAKVRELQSQIDPGE